MRKSNRIIMTTVVILLCLTLVTSCVISGVFAKYTTKRERIIVFDCESFGVTLSMALGTGVTGTVTNSVAGHSLTATVPSLKMAPGDQIYDALKVSITGTANVPVDIKMTCKVVYPDGKDYNDDGVAEYGNAYVYSNKCYMPIGFSCKAYGDTKPVAACYSWQNNKNSSQVSEIIIRNVAEEVFNKTYTSSNSTEVKDDNGKGTGAWYYQEHFNKGTNFSNTINEFAIGMYWPYEYGSEAALLDIEKEGGRGLPSSSVSVFDKIAMQFASKDATFSFVYTITITQAES